MGDRVLVGTRKGLFELGKNPNASPDSPGRWTVNHVSFLGQNISLTLHDPRDGRHYAAINHGHFGVKLHRSLDGRTWDEIPAPKYPPKPEGYKEPEGTRPFAWNLENIWALEPGGPDEPGVLWCGTLPGGLFRSNDHGDSWQLIESLWNHPMRAEWNGGGADYPGIHSICVDPRNSKRVAIGVSTGGVWITSDGAQTWSIKASGMRAGYMPPDQQHLPNVQDVHRMVQSPSDPDTCWVQHHSGIFRTTDNCESWHEITVKPSSFGFGVAVHPTDPDIAWFVPGDSDMLRLPVDARVVVTRTRDGGKSFDILTRGLPQDHAYDLVYRHALDIDKTGDILAFGSTTGHLWITENGGDSWQGVAMHLPPVYSVEVVN